MRVIRARNGIVFGIMQFCSELALPPDVGAAAYVIVLRPPVFAFIADTISRTPSRPFSCFVYADESVEESGLKQV